MMTTPDHAGMADIRLTQAQRLRDGANVSAMIVTGVIAYVCIILIASDHARNAFIWACLTLPMVAVTLIYARFAVSGSISKDNYKRYLRGHILVTIITGLIWSGFSIYHTDYSSYTSLFVVGSIVCSITAGGMFPGSDYRPAYIALAISTILPVAFYWTLTAPPTIRYFALGLSLFFLFGVYSSARAELNSRDGIIARTQRNLSEETMTRMRVIREGYEEKSRFLAATSHDLSQPLHAQGYFLDALGYLLDRPDQKELLDKIRANWTAQKDMLDDLVRVTRLDGGVLLPQPEMTDISSLLIDLCREHQIGIDPKSVVTERDTDPIQAITDPTFLRRIVGNILSNAVKFSPQEGVISVTLRETETGAKITVRDHGPGIPEAGRAALFGAYAQAETDSVRPEGSGLGLSIVKRLSEGIGVSVDLQTPKAGPGLFVAIDVPSMETQRLGTRSPASLVVIIDDDVNIRDAMIAALSNWGVQAIAAETLEEATSLLRLLGQSPDMMIVDYNLGDGIKGGAVISALKDEFGADIPAAIVTGDVSQVQSGPNTQIVLKPVAPPNLRQLVGLSDQTE
jgi:signal transduction histidine kinase/CheY-like chemotaxis protein